MQTRSSVLGKRHAMAEATSPPVTSPYDGAEAKLPLTPESTPTSKRFKSSITIEDDDNNKENIPPLRVEALRSPSITRSGRSLRRTASESLTPTRTRLVPRRASVSATSRPATPTTVPALISLATPPTTPPAALQPICARARALLRLACNNVAPLTGRGCERDEIITFINPFLKGSANVDEHSILYISGSPGTGKTAMVTSVFHDIRSELQAVDAITLTINCMALNNIDALWDRLKDELQDKDLKATKPIRAKKAKDTALETVKRLFGSRPTKYIVVLDELDHIASSSQALNTLFSVVRKYRSHIRLIGIANTHTLSSTSSTELSAEAAEGVKTLHFSPYTAQQLLQILQARLAPLAEAEHPVSEKADNFLPLPTLMLLAKKIAAQTGDVRAAFEVLRGAIDIAVNSNVSANPLAEPTPPVTPAHVLSALKAYAPPAATPRLTATSAVSQASLRKASGSDIVNKVRDLSVHARLAILAMLVARRRQDAGLPLSGSPVTTPTSTPRKRAQAGGQASIPGASDVTHLHAFYKTLLARSDNSAFMPVSRSEFGDLLNMLETVGLVALSSVPTPGSPSKSARRAASFGAMVGRATSQEVRFVDGVRMDEVARGLGVSGDAGSTVGGVREEELRDVWEKERARIARESKVRNGAETLIDTFEEATEN